MIVQYHLYLAKFWNGLSKILRFFTNHIGDWIGQRADYHLAEAEKEIEQLKLP